MDKPLSLNYQATESDNNFKITNDKSNRIKKFESPTYQYLFDRKTGLFVRSFPNNDSIDPMYSPFGPEIADIEISVGKCAGKCQFCYKDNGTDSIKTKHMSTDTFKKLFSKLPETVCQIAFGITDINANPDFWNIMSYSRSNGVIPNYTTNGIGVDERVARSTAEICGAVAVSRSVSRDICYEAIKKYTSAKMTQVNMHFMLADETFSDAINTIYDIASDARLKDMNAIVFLQYKPKGKNVGKFHSISSINKYEYLISLCKTLNITHGFDSCSAPLWLKSNEHESDFQRMVTQAEPCESSLFSSYINVDGIFFPCSFSEGEKNWVEGLDVVNCKDFLKDIWFNPKTIEFRKNIIESSFGCSKCEVKRYCRSCVIHDVTCCKEKHQ